MESEYLPSTDHKDGQNKYILWQGRKMQLLLNSQIEGDYGEMLSLKLQEKL